MLGVPIRIERGFVLVAVATAWLASIRVLAETPFGPGTVAVMALGPCAVGATVLTNGLGTVLAAHLRGIAVDGLALSEQGLARVHCANERQRATDELCVALGGPLASLALLMPAALWCAALGWSPFALPTADGAGPPAVEAAAHCALFLAVAISAVTLAVSLLPIFPLDGARVVFGAAWSITGDRWRALDVVACASFVTIVLGTVVAALLVATRLGAWELALLAPVAVLEAQRAIGALRGIVLVEVAPVTAWGSAVQGPQHVVPPGMRGADLRPRWHGAEPSPTWLAVVDGRRLVGVLDGAAIAAMADDAAAADVMDRVRAASPLPAARTMTDVPRPPALPVSVVAADGSFYGLADALDSAQALVRAAQARPLPFWLRQMTALPAPPAREVPSIVAWAAGATARTGRDPLR